jgi:hypothetical protein
VVDTAPLLHRELLLFVQVADSQLQYRLSRAVTVRCIAGTATRHAKAVEAEAAAVNRLRTALPRMRGFEAALR